LKKIILLGLLISILSGARITPDLQNALQTAKKGEFIRVNLVMEKQLNGLELIKQYPHIYRNKKARRNFVKQALKEFARETQRPVIEKLRELEKQGLVRNIRSLWIANVINFEGTRDAILQIQKLSGIRSLDLDEERILIVNQKDLEKHKKFAPPDNTATPLKTIEWNIPHINAPQVWQLGYTGQGVIVAVLDTGVRYTHWDLADHIWTNPGEIPNNGVDDDGNGYVDDYYGYDFGYNDNDPMDGHGHGTHVSGTVAGDGTAGDTTGVAPDATIMCVKVLDDAGGGTESGVWEGMQYAADNGADIITMSLGWMHAWNPDRATWRSVCDNITAMGVAMTVAAGNERTSGDPAPDNIRTPGDVPPPWIHPDQDPLGATSAVITVGATDNNDVYGYFSSYGPVTWENISPYLDWAYQPEMGLMDPDVSAPGVNITSLDYSSDNGYASGWSGTSMATPHVAGLVALMLSKNPNLTPRQIDSIIELYGVIDLGPAGKDNDYGSGRIDCLAAINATPEPGAPNQPVIISPYNFAKLPVLNPVFKFTATDPQGDDIIYRIYWSTDTTFTVQDSAETPAYPSDSLVQFTLPVALTQGETYWFRIRATDTTSAGLWSPYTSISSFTIDTTLPANFSSWFQTKGAQFKYDQFYGTQIAGDSILLEPFGYIEDTLLVEDFEQGIPTTWTVVDGNNDGYQWTAGTTSDLSTYEPPNYGTQYAYYSDDDAGSSVINYNEELISPVIFIPSTASNLFIQYGYGFRVWETGETFDFYARFFSNGSWTAWTLIKSYTSSGSGTENFDLTSYLPADSVQFRWVYHDENSTSHWGWACAVDNVIVLYNYTFQNNEGTVTTAPISFGEFLNTYPKNNWGYVVWEKATPDDSIGIQIEYYDGNAWQLIPDTDLPGNSTGFFTTAKIGSVSLESLDTTVYNTLRVKALLYRKGVLTDPNEPSLLSIEIGAPPVVSVKETETVNSPYLKVSPLIFRDHITFKFSIAPLSEAKLKIFNSSGRLIKQEIFKSGNSGTEITYIWNAKGKNGKKLGSGIYFIKFENGKYKKTLKALLIK
jgi:hypothetical protein